MTISYTRYSFKFIRSNTLWILDIIQDENIERSALR